MTSDGDDEIFLMCAMCAAERPHEIEYAGRLVLCVRCLRCGSETREPSPHLMSDYVDDLAHRLLTKPGRLVGRMRRHPLTTVPESVLGLARQPGKIAREIRAIRAANRGRARPDDRRR